MSENGNGYRTYDSGASRDTGIGKLEFSRYTHPAVTKRYAVFMQSKQTLPDGSQRRGDNWQKGIPTGDLIESLERHDSDIQLHLKEWGEEATEDLQTACCAALFNIQAILLKELEKQREISQGISSRSEGKSEEAVHGDRSVDNSHLPTNGSTPDDHIYVGSGREVGTIHSRGRHGSGLAGSEDVRDRALRESSAAGEIVLESNTILIPQPESET